MDDLSQVKTGDRVVILHRGEAFAIKTVDHTTDNYIVLGSTRYRRRDGASVGSGSWDSPCIALPNDRYAEQITRSRAIARLARFDWKSLSTQTLTNVLALLPPFSTGAKS